MIRRFAQAAAVAIGIWATAAAAPAFAQFSVTITVDEFGHGRLTNSAGTNISLPSAMQADSGPGGLPAALTYSLGNPPGLTAGDLILLEPGTGGSVISDIIRFNPNETAPDSSAGALVFYSDTTDGSDSLADIGFPSSLYANTLTLNETGLIEFVDGITYTPTAGQPGFVTGAAGPVTYVIQSDVAAPEPSSLSLIGLGLGAGLAGLSIRRRRRIVA